MKHSYNYNHYRTNRAYKNKIYKNHLYYLLDNEDKLRNDLNKKHIAYKKRVAEMDRWTWED